jgi:hypothetical protein
MTDKQRHLAYLAHRKRFMSRGERAWVNGCACFLAGYFTALFCGVLG